MTYNKKQQSYKKGKGASHRRSSSLEGLLRVLPTFILLVSGGVILAVNLGLKSFLFPQNKTELNEKIVEGIEKEGIIKTQESDEKIYKKDDIIPYFPGCENISENIYDKWRCSIEKAKGVIYDNLEYPAAYISKGGGSVHVRFVVDKNGNVINPEIYHNPNVFGDAVIKAFQKMPRWIPATKEGVPVHAQRSLVIYIYERQYIVSDKSAPLKSGDGHFVEPDKMAYFKECEGMTEGEKFVCNKQYIRQYANSRIYEGNTVSLRRNDATKSYSTYLRFQVNKEGNITNIKAQCGEETENKLVKRKLEDMPQWIPAQHNGGPVNVEFIFPCTKTSGGPGY